MLEDSLFKGTLLVYHSKTPAVYTPGFKTTNMEVHTGYCDSFLNCLTELKSYEFHTDETVGITTQKKSHHNTFPAIVLRK